MFDVIIIGAGPIGLACAIELKRLGVTSLLLEQGSVADAVRRFPSNMTFFSTAELIELKNIPMIAQGFRPSRYEALKYYSRVAESERLNIRRYTKAVSISGNAGSFRVQTGKGETLEARRIIVATGYYDQPNLLGVPGEGLPHVSHYYDEGLRYTGMTVVVVGGQNSACDTALDLYRSGAKVTLVHRDESLGHSVKYWIRPDIENRIRDKEITALMSSEVTAITPGAVSVRSDGELRTVPADFVFVMCGYHPDVELLESAGVIVDKESLIPFHDANTLETNVPGLYIAGSVIAGRRTSDIFIENGRIHAALVAEKIAAQKNISTTS